jgi:hypothetical protein
MKKSIQLGKRTAAVAVIITAIFFATVVLNSESGQPANAKPLPGPAYGCFLM